MKRRLVPLVAALVAGAASSACTTTLLPESLLPEFPPTCTESGATCWISVANRVDCRVWDGNLRPQDIITWTGECSNGIAHGQGTLTTSYINRYGVNERAIITAVGELRHGQRYGRWTSRGGHIGAVYDGHWVDGVAHGPWTVERYGDVDRGHFVDGKRSGVWTLHKSNGDVHESYFLDGEVHGPTTIRKASGAILQGCYNHFFDFAQATC